MQFVLLLLCIGLLIGATIPLSLGLLPMQGVQQSKRSFWWWFRIAFLAILLSLLYMVNLVNW